MVVFFVYYVYNGVLEVLGADFFPANETYRLPMIKLSRDSCELDMTGEFFVSLTSGRSRAK